MFKNKHVFFNTACSIAGTPKRAFFSQIPHFKMPCDQVRDPIKAGLGRVGDVAVIQVLVFGRETGQAAQVDQGEAQPAALLGEDVHIVTHGCADAVGGVPGLGGRDRVDLMRRLAA